MKSKLRPRCFFDIDIGHSPAGRIVFELYDDLCPKTTENFIKLCTGECGVGDTTGKKLHYLNSTFHRVVKGFMIQGGDFSNGDGTGGESIYGGRFSDENLETPHDKPFLLSMANCGADTNGSQFFITTKVTPHLDGKHVVFGHVVSGENLIESIENLPVNANNKPVVDATISNCGELIPIRKKKSKKQKEKEASADSSSSKGKKKKKSKKKKHRNKTKKIKLSKEDESLEIYPKCSVRPDEIPEVPKPYFLYRGSLKEEQANNGQLKNDFKENDIVDSSFTPKDIIGRSGRIIKGRGQLKYQSKSPTPEHWKKDSYRTENQNSNDRHENEDRFKRRRIPSSDSNDDRQRHRIVKHEKAGSRHGSKTRETRAPVRQEKREKYEFWKDVHSEDKSRRQRPAECELKSYGDIEMIDQNHSKSNQKDRNRRRSTSLDKSRQDRVKVPSNNENRLSKTKEVLPRVQQEKAEIFDFGKIIFPYGDESDDSLKPKKVDKVPESKLLSESKSKTMHVDSKDKIEEVKKSSRNEISETNKKTDRPRKRSSSADNFKNKSKSPVEVKSPPAHLVAKWQNRREKIMTRRSPMSRSNERNHSRSRHSPRRHSSKYSKSPRSDKISNENKPRVDHKVIDSARKISAGKSKDNRSSSGTADSSLSSAGSSVSNRPCRIDSDLSDTEKSVNTQCWVNDSNSNQKTITNKDKKPDSGSNNQVDKVKETNEVKAPESSKETEKEALMVLKVPEKPWLTSQWTTEEEEANKRNAKTKSDSILAKLREDDEKKLPIKLPQEKQDKPTLKSADNTRQEKKKIPSPVSQSISKYRSPSGTKSSDDHARSSYSSSSSSRSYSKRRSTRRSRTRSRSYRRGYRGSRYRRSASRSGRRYRSRSYSRGSRRRYSSRSRSSSTSRSSRYRRSSRRNYRGLGFRRPSASPRPRK